MSNHVPTNAASGAVRGGLLGGILGFLAIPAIVATGAALLVAGGFIGAGAVTAAAAAGGSTLGVAATYAGIAGLVSTVAFSLPFMPVNWAMAAYGAAGGGLFGAAGGVERGMHENVQEQARGAYINAYAQTRAGIDQMAMQAAYAPPVMQMQAPEQLVAANENTPKLQIHADSAEHHGKQHAHTQAVSV